MKDIELPPLPQPGEALSKWAYDESDMQSYARAAVEADRTQRVPEGLILAVIGHKHFGNPIPREWYAAAKELLASTPAQPAQQEPSDATIAQIDREIEAMLTQVESGSFPELPARTLELAREVAKLIVAQHQEPPQPVERKPMTELEKRNLALNYFSDEWAISHAINMLSAAERHHGIRE